LFLFAFIPPGAGKTKAPRENKLDIQTQPLAYTHLGMRIGQSRDRKGAVAFFETFVQLILSRRLRAKRQQPKADI